MNISMQNSLSFSENLILNDLKYKVTALQRADKSIVLKVAAYVLNLFNTIKLVLFVRNKNDKCEYMFKKYNLLSRIKIGTQIHLLNDEQIQTLKVSKDVEIVKNETAQMEKKYFTQTQIFSILKTGISLDEIQAYKDAQVQVKAENTVFSGCSNMSSIKKLTCAVGTLFYHFFAKKTES